VRHLAGGGGVGKVALAGNGKSGALAAQPGGDVDRHQGSSTDPGPAFLVIIRALACVEGLAAHLWTPPGPLRHTVGGSDLDGNEVPSAVAQHMLSAWGKSGGRRLLAIPAETRCQPASKKICLAVIGGGILVTRGVLNGQLLDACEIGAYIGRVEELRDNFAPRPLCGPACVADGTAGALAVLQIVERGKTSFNMQHL